jgi:hypothetical protein
MEDVWQLVDQHHSIELPGFSPYSAVQVCQPSWSSYHGCLAMITVGLQLISNAASARLELQLI